MKQYLALILFAISTWAYAGTHVYDAAFNQYGYTTMQTDTMQSLDSAIVVFTTPAEGKYLIQILNGFDSNNNRHEVQIYDSNNNLVMSQQGFYPSFYVTLGTDLQSFTPYVMYVYNRKKDGTESCAKLHPCNIMVLIQPVN